MVGITGFGAYIPRRRLQRAAVVEANKWANPGVASLARGERSMANWDEDSVTLAVEAARDCLAGADRSTIGHISLASTTLPFTDRQNAGIVATALSLPAGIGALDVGGSQRAGTSALIGALEAEGVFARMPGVAPLDRCIRISCGPVTELDVLEDALPRALDRLSPA